MALFSVKTSKKVDTSIRLEESTAKMLDRYAHFHQGPADEVVNKALEYIFTKDKDFQQYLRTEQNANVPSSLRVKKAPAPAKAAKPSTNGNGSPNDSSGWTAVAASLEKK